MVDIELFAGAGGLAIGVSNVGFGPGHYFEIDPHSCQTLRHNVTSKKPTLAGEVHEGDVCEVDWKDFSGKVRLLAAGAPCQPFSLAGKHKAYEDGRNQFPQVFRAIRELNPAAIILENVRGLVRANFFPYFEYILAQLECPSVSPKKDELWQDHFDRIKRHRCAPGVIPEYIVSWRLVDAANFGVPQNRHRVFIVATRNDIPVYTFPSPTHSKQALIRAQANGDYWEKRDLPKKKPLISNGHSVEFDDGFKPWVTVRDALEGLDEPAESEEESKNNHWKIPGAKRYHGHNGSLLDLPSKAIKAGVHGVPGGENTFFDHKGKLRYYTLREAARIQTFPDNHIFKGTKTKITKQIGNAVPSGLAEAIVTPLYDLLKKALPKS